MAIQLAAVFTAISGITVSGLTIADVSAIPDGVDVRVPILYPNPARLVTDFRIEDASFGAAASMRQDIYYTLNYIYWHTPIGSGRGLFDTYPPMVTLILNFVDAFNALDALNGAVEWRVSIGDFGPVLDPSQQNPGHGCAVTFAIHEFRN